VSISLDGLPADGKLDVPAMLFSESNTRWIAEIAPEREAELALLLHGLPAAKVGVVTTEPVLEVTHAGGLVLRKGCADLKAAWQRTFARQCSGASANSRGQV
jgi:phosphoribosylformylglycinamidine synthase